MYQELNMTFRAIEYKFILLLFSCLSFDLPGQNLSDCHFNEVVKIAIVFGNISQVDSLISTIEYRCLNIPSDEKSTYLHYALISGEYEIANLLVSRGAQVNVLNDVGRNLWYYLIDGIDNKFIQELEDNSISPYKVDQYGGSVLSHALTNENLDLLQYLYQKHGIAFSSDHLPAAEEVVNLDDTLVYKYLYKNLNEEARGNLMRQINDEELILSSPFSINFEILRFLVEDGLNIVSLGESQKSGLHYFHYDAEIFEWIYYYLKGIGKEATEKELNELLEYLLTPPEPILITLRDQWGNIAEEYYECNPISEKELSIVNFILDRLDEKEEYLGLKSLVDMMNSIPENTDIPIALRNYFCRE